MLSATAQFWIGFPTTYALTVGGLVSGYRRGGVPSDERLTRAFRAGVPVMLGVLTLWTCLISSIQTLAQRNSLAWIDLPLGILFVISTSALTGRTLAQRNPANALKRGTVVEDSTDRDSTPTNPDALTLAGHPIHRMDETKHFKFIGTTGTGKSTAIRELLAKAVARGDRAVIADPDGGYARLFFDPSRGDVILNPFDSRAARWDLYSEITLPQDADHLARSFFPDCSGDERIWRGYARTYVGSLLRQLHRKKEAQDLGRLYYLLSSAPQSDLQDLLQGTPAQRFLGEDGGRFLHSVQSTAMHHLEALEHVARQKEGDAIGVRKWIREGRGVLFLPYSATEIASLSHLISAWMRLAIFETLSAEERDHKIWFVIDELDALGAVDGLKDALTRLRKFGGRCILGLQSIAQVRGAYGDAQAQSIIENCGSTLILRCSASERGGTAEFASKLIGQRQIERKQHSTSRTGWRLLGKKTRTVSDHLFTEDAVMASEIEQLPDLAGFLKLPSKPQWYRVTLKHADH